MGPLAGIRVVDMTTVVMGPMASRILGDLGADVIKIEAPAYDSMRDFEPHRSPGMSGFTLNLNRNKRSVLLDLKTDDGRRALLDIVATSDVFLTNMRPSALERLGLAPDDLLAVRDDLIYCGAVGFGSDGPYAGRAAYDDVIQAVSGMASMFEWNGGQPAYLPSIVADKISALHIAYAINAALFQRATTGRGDVIEVPMAEALAAFNLVEHLNGNTFEPKEPPFSYARIRSSQRKPRRSADGWICLMPYDDANWRAFFGAIGRPELADDERFAGVNARVINVDALYAVVDEFAPQHTTAEWMALCEELSIPCVPVTDLEHLDEDPHFDAVGLLQVVEHPTEGPYRVVRDAVRFESDPSPTVHRHAPRVGQHTAEILAEVGWSRDDIEALDPST